MEGDEHHWGVVRTLLLCAALVVALLVAGGVYVVRMVAKIDATTSAVLSNLETHGMATLTFTTTLDDGTVVTYTATQQPNETYTQFAARARQEWAEILEGLGQ